MPRTGYDTAPPAAPDRVLRTPRYSSEQHRPTTARELHELCVEHGSGVTGIARLIGCTPRTIRRHLQWEPGRGKPPELSYPVFKRLGELAHRGLTKEERHGMRPD